MSFDRLQDAIDRLQNPTVCGLDPTPEYIPPRVMRRRVDELGPVPEAVAEAYFDFNSALIDALRDIVPAVKPQSAFYEMLGPCGARALARTADYARRSGMYVILDAKRGDIGSTALAYSEGYLGSVVIEGREYEPYGFDAMTINAYLGSDGVRPFLETAKRRDKALFALVKTSNPSSGELQDIDVGGGRKLYHAVGDMLEELAADTVGERGFSRAGMVAGATYPAELAVLRARYANTFFLVPGYGAQGGGARDAAAAFLPGGRGAVVNSSRAVICAWKKTGNGGDDFAEAARDEALRMRADLRERVY
jgi:orotidine-5'-phosphate decarboxylase